MVDVSSDAGEADLATVELLGGDAARVALLDRIAVRLVCYRWRPTELSAVGAQAIRDTKESLARGGH
jgi:hypothetical protein